MKVNIAYYLSIDEKQHQVSTHSKTLKNIEDIDKYLEKEIVTNVRRLLVSELEKKES